MTESLHEQLAKQNLARPKEQKNLTAKSEIGKRIDRIIQVRDETRSHVAKLIGLSRQTFTNRLDNGKFLAEDLVGMSQALNVSLEFLLTGDDPVLTRTAHYMGYAYEKVAGILQQYITQRKTGAGDDLIDDCTLNIPAPGELEEAPSLEEARAAHRAEQAIGPTSQDAASTSESVLDISESVLDTSETAGHIPDTSDAIGPTIEQLRRELALTRGLVRLEARRTAEQIGHVARAVAAIHVGGRRARPGAPDPVHSPPPPPPPVNGPPGGGRYTSMPPGWRPQ